MSFRATLLLAPPLALALLALVGPAGAEIRAIAEQPTDDCGH